MIYSCILLVYTLFSPPVTNVSVALASTANGGEIHLAVYPDREAFEREKTIAGAKSRLSGQSTATEIAVELPATGEYVFAAFHDLNGNGKLDRNVFGVPLEPYGFAKEPPTKWRAPAFGEVAARVSPQTTKLHIALRRWKER